MNALALVHQLLEYSGFEAQTLNSNQPIPEEVVVLYTTQHQPWALSIARIMRQKYGINIWVDGTVSTGWRIMVHRDDRDRAKRMFSSSL